MIIIWCFFFLSIKHKFWARKRNVLMRRFFYASKTYVTIDSYQNSLWISPVLWIQFVPILFRISKYFEKSKFEISRFYCTQCAILIVLRAEMDTHRKKNSIVEHRKQMLKLIVKYSVMCSKICLSLPMHKELKYLWAY